MKALYKLVLLLFSMLIGTSCEKNDHIFAREDDEIIVDCIEQSIEQIILCSGEWVADVSGVDWVTVSPESGTGNGKDYGYFTVNIQYNSGAAREGIINLMYEGQSYPIKVSQEKNKFAYGSPAFEGNLFVQSESPAKIIIPYTFASGKELVQVSYKMTGSSEGLSTPIATYDSFLKGDGVIELPVEGKPEVAGDVVFEIFIDGVSVGTCTATILEDPNALAEGLPVGWNFYAAGVSPRGSEYDVSWTTDAITPTAEILPQNGHKVLPTSGNKSAYLTAYSNNVTSTANYAFNPSIQIRGLMENDYFYCVIPVKNIKETHQLKVEASMGSAGSAAGYYALEYSNDGGVWHLADGATVMEVFGASAPVHYYVPSINASDDRKTYNKETDQGYRVYTFPLRGIKNIYNGNLYLRLRVCMNRRTNSSESTNTIAANTWADLKGIEIELINN